MSRLPEHPAWDFITSLYAMKDVAPACLALQERHDMDVTLMLFCLWRGAAGDSIPDARMATLAAAARDWRAATVLPVRAARRWLKQRPEQEGLYRTVLAAEIDCEHGELLMLAQLTDANGGQCPPSAPQAMAENLEAVFRERGIRQDAQDRQAVAVILAAASALTEAGPASPQQPVT